MQVQHYPQNELGEWWDAILKTGTQLYTARQEAKGVEAQAAAVKAQARAVEAQAAAEIAAEQKRRAAAAGGSERELLMMQLFRPKGVPQWVVPAAIGGVGLLVVFMMMQKPKRR